MISADKLFCRMYLARESKVYRGNEKQQCIDALIGAGGLAHDKDWLFWRWAVGS